MSDEFQYIEDDESGVRAVHVQFDEAETKRLLGLAEWWAALCKLRGRAPPPDPMRAVLESCEHMHVWMSELTQRQIMALRDAHGARMH